MTDLPDAHADARRRPDAGRRAALGRGVHRHRDRPGPGRGDHRHRHRRRARGRDRSGRHRERVPPRRPVGHQDGHHRRGRPGRRPDQLRPVRGRGDLHVPRRGRRGRRLRADSPMAFTISDGETVDLTGLPVGASCTTAEPGSADAVQVNITPQTVDDPGHVSIRAPRRGRRRERLRQRLPAGWSRRSPATRSRTTRRSPRARSRCT